MADATAGMTPPLVWKYFAAFSKIPRCSKHEQAAGKFVMDTAKQLGLTARQDRSGNVVVRKPASPGRERVKSLCLQGHLDMVCEKNAGKTHDFSKDPIELVRKGNFLMANGTTLGADNGIAVATNLAIMEDKGLVHGPLELLFTVDEETGLTGAHNLEPGFLESKTLMNLDSEEEGALYVGCSGGKDTTATWSVEAEPVPNGWVGFEVALTGLRGAMFRARRRHDLTRGAPGLRRQRRMAAKSARICSTIFASTTRVSGLSGSFSEYSWSFTVPHCGPSASGS